MYAASRDIIRDFKIYEAGYDFMGYRFKDPFELTNHHGIIPREDCSFYGLGNGYTKWNGIILVRETSHNYLHIVETFDNDKFFDITSELLDQKIKGRLDAKNIRNIDLILKEFEKEYEGAKGFDNKILIKRKYLDRIYYK